MAKISAKYWELIRSFPLRPIRSEADLGRAEAMLHRLLDAPSLSASEQDYLEILGNVIDEYESKAHPIESLPPNQMLAISIESKGVTQTEVSRATGIPVSTISELIAQKREFNRAHVEKLCDFFGLDPKVFIQVGNRKPARLRLRPGTRVRSAHPPPRLGGVAATKRRLMKKLG
jgi:HTH-type transcriptional regulator/antitoxin HigA